MTRSAGSGTPVPDYVRDAIVAECVAQSISQGALAERLGWSAEYMSKRMRGQVDFRLSELTAIADALAVRLVDLFPTTTSKE